MTGGPLAQWAGRLPVANVRLVLTQLLDAIAHIHARNGLHRDIKPENLLVGPDGNFSVGDFGLGNNPRFTVMFTAHAAGTWGYMAPELGLPNAVATRAADIYSAGATIFNLLTGIHPGEAKTLDPAMYRSDVPNDLRALILKMVSADPRLRPTATAARDALSEKRPAAKSDGSGVVAAIVGFGVLALIAAALSE
jgi:serine/threonine protein kinase